MITIGFIGTGLMGLPMAKNILKSGFKLKAFNRSIEKAEPLKEFGAEISKSISDVVNDSDFVITMLTDDSAVDAITSSTDFLDNLKSGSTVIDMSSVKPLQLISLLQPKKLKKKSLRLMMEVFPEKPLLLLQKQKFSLPNLKLLWLTIKMSS